MGFFPIAASDMDMIIGIIAVIGWILAQVMGRKKDGGTPDGSPPPSAPPTDPQDELRKFFEEMEKTLAPKVEPKPAVPPPVPAHQHRAPARKRAPVVIETPVTPPALRAPVAARTEPPMIAPELTLSALPTSVLPVVHSRMTEGIGDPATLRRMIVAMEVLGKPVALKAL